MKINELKHIIVETIINTINEGWYDKSTTPYFSKGDVNRTIGSNPLTVDNGSHSSNDTVIQPSTIDFNGERLDAEPIYLSTNKFMIYKIKNFGNDKIDSTLSFFGKSASGEKLFRNAIDTLYGAANRNGKNVIFRTIASVEENPKRNSLRKTFWEFSFDNGNNWYLLIPKPVQNMKLSKLIKK